MADPCKCLARPAGGSGANLTVDRQNDREGFKAEALAAWAEYQETGQYLSGGEIIAWLNTWGTADEGECPPCHQREAGW